jgi:hypothetical protein
LVATSRTASSNLVVAALLAAAVAVLLGIVAMASGSDEPLAATAVLDPAGAETEPEPEPTSDPGPEPELAPEPVLTEVAPLTGVAITDEDAAEIATRPALLAKIPNDPDARPQTGLERADVVYEQETEAGITRFVAAFHSDLPEVVGNIRSARLVDPAIVAPYQGVMAYSGARQEVRNQVAAAGLTTVTEGGAGFFRDSARRAPHNLYLRPRQTLASRSAAPASASPWTFDEEPPSGGTPTDGRVSVAVSRSATVGWEYDPDEGVFRRFQNGSYHTVTGDGAIGAANVVFLDVAVAGRDSHGAPVYDLTGTRAAKLLRDGRSYDIQWSKAGREAPLELVDGADAAHLKPGPTWIVLTYGGALTD